MVWLVTFVYAYLLGSIPFGYILVRNFRKEDIRATGSGNIGATNVARAGGKGLGIATLFFDALKGWLAVILVRVVVKAFHAGVPHPAAELAAFAAVAAILGHCFTVWLGFKGGKGVATALGVFLALSWPSALAALVVFAATVWLTRYVSLGSVIAAVSLPIFVYVFTPNRSLFFMLCTIFVSLLVIVKHRSNIARLLDGTESMLIGDKTRRSQP